MKLTGRTFLSAFFCRVFFFLMSCHKMRLKKHFTVKEKDGIMLYFVIKQDKNVEDKLRQEEKCSKKREFRK